MATLKSLKYVCNETPKCLSEDYGKNIKMQVGVESLEALVKVVTLMEFFLPVCLG